LPVTALDWPLGAVQLRFGNSHMVPSGIVAVGHAQESGYAYAYCG
jgi:hypothetical protein